MTSRRFEGPQKIGDSLTALIKWFARTDLVGIAALDDQWRDLVGATLAAHSSPRALRGTVLVVSVDQPAWATQFRLLVGGRLERFSEVAGCRVESIEVTVRR